jgi:hypothetical protein
VPSSHRATSSARGATMDENTSHLRVIASAVGSGVVAALVWGTATKVLNHHIGYLALAVGAIVGLSVKHIGKSSGIAGGVAAGVVSIIACFAGDLFAANWILGSEGIRLTVSQLWQLTLDINTPMTYLIYAIGAYGAFLAAGGKDAMRQSSVAAGTGRFTPDSIPAPAPAAAPAPAVETATVTTAEAGSDAAPRQTGL